MPGEEVRVWLLFAREDPRKGTDLLKQGLFHRTCFLTRQAADKAVKSYILHSTVGDPRSTGAGRKSGTCAGGEGGALCLLDLYYDARLYLIFCWRCSWMGAPVPCFYGRWRRSSERRHRPANKGGRHVVFPAGFDAGAVFQSSVLRRRTASAASFA